MAKTPKKEGKRFTSSGELRDAVEATPPKRRVDGPLARGPIEEDPRARFRCKFCQGDNVYVVRSRIRGGRYSRYRACRNGHRCFWTVETPE